MTTDTSAVQRPLQSLQIDKVPFGSLQHQAVDALEAGQAPSSFRCTVSKYSLPNSPRWQARVFRLNDGDYLMFRGTQGSGFLGMGAAGRCHLGRSPQGQWLCIKEISLVAPPSSVQFKAKAELSVNPEQQQYLREITQKEAVFASKFGGALAPWFYLERSDNRKVYLITPLAVASLWDAARVEWRDFVPPEQLRQTILEQLLNDFSEQEKVDCAEYNARLIEIMPPSVKYTPRPVRHAPRPQAITLIEMNAYNFRNLFPRNELGQQWCGEAIWSLLRSVAADLVNLHHHGILHNDLRGDNIMVGGKDHLPHLIDFNCTVNLHEQTPWKDSSLPPAGAPLFDRAPELAGSNIHGFYDIWQLRREDWLKSDIYALAWVVIEMFREGEDKTYLRRQESCDEIRRMITPNDGLLPEDVEIIRYWELSGKKQTEQQAWPTLPLIDRQRIDSYWQNINQLPKPLPQLLAKMMSIHPKQRPSAAELLKELDSQPVLPPEAEQSWWHFFQSKWFFYGGVDIIAHFEEVEKKLRQTKHLAVDQQSRSLAAEQMLTLTNQIPPVLSWRQKRLLSKPEKILSVEECIASLRAYRASLKPQEKTLSIGSTAVALSVPNAEATPTAAGEEHTQNSTSYNKKNLIGATITTATIGTLLWWGYEHIQEYVFSQLKPAA